MRDVYKWRRDRSLHLTSGCLPGARTVFKLSLPAFVDGLTAELSLVVVDEAEVGAAVEQAASAARQSSHT